MKKLFWLGLVAGVLVVGAGIGVSAVYAQEEPPFPTPSEGGPWGRGPMYGHGLGFLGEYRDIMHEALAEALDLSVEELVAAREDGTTLFELAEQQGVEMETLWSVMDDARAEMIDQALADGVITEEQADWMSERGGPGPGHHFGSCDGSGPRGGGFGRRGGFGG